MENERRIPSNKLNDVVDCLINSLMPKAYSNKNFFVNDIPDHFQLEKELPVITSVLGGLLSTVISNVKDSCIRLSAKLYGNIVLVDVKIQMASILMLSGVSFSNCRRWQKKTKALLLLQHINRVSLQ